MGIITLISLYVLMLYAEPADGAESYTCGTTKMFDGRPKEYRGSDGKEITALRGYYTRNQCATKCIETAECQEFRIKKNRSVSYSGCVLMRSGTTYSGKYTKDYEMHRLDTCSEKLFDGRPKEYRGSDGKEIAAYSGYWTRQQCGCKCQENSECKEFRIKKNRRVSYSGCVLMRSGTTRSGDLTSDYEMYKLAACPGTRKRDVLDENDSTYIISVPYE